MARSNNNIPNFTGGEISPRSSARRDLEGYYNSTEYQVNFISDLQGGARFRPGSLIGTEATGFRLIPFIYDALDNYFVEIGKWVRIISPNGRPKISNASGVNTWSIERVEKRTDQIVYHVSNISYANLLITNLFTIFDISPELDDEFKVYADGYLDDSRIAAINTSSIDGTWREVVVTATGTTASAAVTPAQTMTLIQNDAFLANYTAEEAQRLQFAQRRDELWMTVGTEPAKKLTRSVGAAGEIIFSFANAPIHQDGSSTNYAPLTTAGDPDAEPPTPNEYPYCVALYEDRIWFAHTDKNPSTLWGSQKGSVSRFDPESDPLVDNDRIVRTINSNGSDINFILPDKDQLYLGCLDGAFSASGGSSRAAMTPANFQFKFLHTVGTTLGRPFFQYESDLYFVDRGGTGLWRVVYNFNTEKFEPEMITLASDNLVKPGIRSAAVKNGDDARIFLTLNGGAALANTISRIYGSKAFTRLEAGLSEAQESQYAFGNICNLPSATSQDTVGGIITAASGRGVIFTFAPEFTSTAFLKDDIRTRFGSNEIEATDAYNGYTYFKSQFAEHLDLTLKGGDVRIANLTFGATTGAGVTLTASSGVFAAGDVGKRILIATVPSLVSNIGQGVALITGFTSSTVVTVTIEQELNGTFIGADTWYLSTPQNTTINLSSFLYANYFVDMLIDGVVYPNIFVGPNLEINMPADGYIFQIGFKYPGVLKTVNMQGIGQLGTSEGLKKNLHKMRVNFFETGQGTSYGTSFYRLEALDFTQLDDPTDRPAPLFTGEKEIRFDENWEEEKHIYIRHSGGTPCTVLSLIPFFNTSMD